MCGLALDDIKIYYKPIVIKIVWQWHKIGELDP